MLLPRGLLEVSTERRPFSVELEASSRHRSTAGRIPNPSRMDNFMNVTLSDRVILFSFSLMLPFLR
jgi:hypothetical protein